jgi:hypothetical protein
MRNPLCVRCGRRAGPLALLTLPPACVCELDGLQGGAGTLRGLRFESNSAVVEGGGASLRSHSSQSTSSVVLTDSQFIGNTAGNGAGLLITNTVSSMSGNNFTRNTAACVIVGSSYFGGSGGALLLIGRNLQVCFVCTVRRGCTVSGHESPHAPLRVFSVPC